MLTVITNILLTVMMLLPLPKILVNTLEQDMTTAQTLETVLNDNMEDETETSVLNRESFGDTTSAKQESHELNKVQSSTTSDVEKMMNTNSLEPKDEEKKVAAFEKLQAALNQSKIDEQTVEDQSVLDEKVENQAFMLSQTGEEMVVAQPMSLNNESVSNPEEEIAAVFKDFRQTFYSVTSGEVKVGYGLTYQDDAVKVIDNVMHYYDEQYEWIPIVAVNIDEVLEVGLNERGIPNYYGTILEITYPEGETQKAIVLDACGACSWDNRIDLWVYDYDYQHDVKGIQYRVIREGFKNEEEQSGY